MAEKPDQEEIYQNTKLLISRWRQEALKTEKFDFKI